MRSPISSVITQNRPMVITSKPATGQVFGTRVSTPWPVDQGSGFSAFLIWIFYRVATGLCEKCGKRFVLSKQLVEIIKKKLPRRRFPSRYVSC